MCVHSRCRRGLEPVQMFIGWDTRVCGFSLLLLFSSKGIKVAACKLTAVCKNKTWNCNVLYARWRWPSLIGILVNYKWMISFSSGNEVKPYILEWSVTHKFDSKCWSIIELFYAYLELIKFFIYRNVHPSC